MGAVKCDRCEAEMPSGRENYLYAECGLPNVVLEDVEVHRCKSCGNHSVVVPRVLALHRAITTAVIMKHDRLTGGEVRFIRKYLGLSGEDFARVLGVTRTTVSRWETEAEPVGPQADRLVRLVVACRTPATKYPIENLSAIDSSASAATRVRARVADGQWSTHAA